MLTEREKAAIAKASDELGLAEWYRASVNPLLHAEEDRMPSCCGAGCEPCADTLIAVAERAREILAEAGEVDDTGT